MRKDELMLLCFVDESFKPDFYGFGGIMADGATTKALTASLDQIMTTAGRTYGVASSTELHAHPMFHGKDGWSRVPTRVRISIYEQVVDAIADSGATLLARGVRRPQLELRQFKRGYPERHPPEQVAFLHLLQRVHEVANREGTYALVIADERDDRERHRERFATYQAFGTPGAYMHSTLDTLLDTVHFAPSHHSRMLQAADILTFTWTRYQTVRESDPRQQGVMNRLMSKLYGSGRFYDSGRWP